MAFQLNISAIAVAGQMAWKRAKPVVVRDVVLLPAIGFLGIIILWWIVALANHELMPTPPEALVANLDYILNPFSLRNLLPNSQSFKLLEQLLLLLVLAQGLLPPASLATRHKPHRKVFR